MIKNRVYQDTTLTPGTVIELDQRAAHHLRQVLRMRSGESIILFNGSDLECAAELEIEGKRVHARIVRSLRNEPQSRPRIELVQAISRGDRMDTSIQKAVELGVSGVRPVYSERSIKTLDEHRERKKMQHWRGIIISACEQSGRCRLPALDRPVPLTNYLVQRDRNTPALILNPEANASMTDTLIPCEAQDLLIGPEGGWSDAEVEAAVEAGVTGVSLGPRILRTETAGPAALAVIQALIGDFK